MRFRRTSDSCTYAIIWWLAFVICSKNISSSHTFHTRVPIYLNVYEGANDRFSMYVVFPFPRMLDCGLIGFAVFKIIGLMSFEHYIQSTETFTTQNGNRVEVPDFIFCTTNAVVSFEHPFYDTNGKLLSLQNFTIADLGVDNTICTDRDTVTVFTAHNVTMDSKIYEYIRFEIKPLPGYSRASIGFGVS